jgi:hypothetical protein
MLFNAVSTICAFQLTDFDATDHIGFQSALNLHFSIGDGSPTLVSSAARKPDFHGGGGSSK